MRAKYLISVALLAHGTAGFAASGATDFGIRAVGRGAAHAASGVFDGLETPLSAAHGSAPVNLAGAARMGSQFGRVTSLRRSVEHNRRVGGVANSYHLSGRAIDIARAPGVRHSAIDRAYRAAGYHVIESLDEGDHSHLAFGWGGHSPTLARLDRSVAGVETTQWKVILAPR